MEGRAAPRIQSVPETTGTRPPLRERKRLKTRAAIQTHALRLFRQQGYSATTVDQIAEAADVSPSTFFRYFPTKEDVALYDALDPVMFQAFLEQPSAMSPIGALRAAMRQVFAAQSPELDQQYERAALLMAVPELRMRMLDEGIRSVRDFASVIAQRAGREPDDPAVLTIAGAVIGVGMTIWLTHGGTMDAGLIDAMDEGLARLEVLTV